jgi:hypothetical protein
VMVHVQLALILRPIALVVLLDQRIGRDGTVIIHVLLSTSSIPTALIAPNAVHSALYAAKHRPIVQSAPYQVSLKHTCKTQLLSMEIALRFVLGPTMVKVLEE